MNKKKDIRQQVKDSDILISLGIFFLISAGYFLFVARYVLYFQETQTIFIFSGEYFQKFLLKPGGLLEYASRFLTQFYAGKFAGPLILSIVLTLPGLILFYINRRMIRNISYSLLFILLPSFFILLLQANYFHIMEVNLGFILILCFYLFIISSDKKPRKILVIILFPFFYFLAGAYAMVFLVMFIIHYLSIEKDKNRYLFIYIILLVAAITFLFSWKVIFLQPIEQFILNPLPLLENAPYRTTFVILGAYIIFYPFICRIAMRATDSILNTRLYSIVTGAVVLIISMFLLNKTYNPQTARVIELEKLVFSDKFEDAIKYQAEHPSRNLIGEYFFNIALSETDHLCDSLFFGSQSFGAGSLILPWGDIHLNRGAYFYYSIGLINEAHRWAYEEMVVYGYRPENIEMLVKTSLINGDFRMARKYINILKKTIYYRRWAKEYEKMIDNPDLVASHPDLGKKVSMLPKTEFFIQFNEPQNNIPMILRGQPENRRAIDYYLADLLLSKEVEQVVNVAQKMESVGYTRIPRHVEEAILLYYNSTQVFPDLGGLEINPETLRRFDQYFAAYVAGRNNPNTLQSNMEKNFGNTFWFYFHFK